MPWLSKMSNFSLREAMNPCEVSKAISQDVAEFMYHVPEVKEESITDYLMWKWSEQDKRLRYIKSKGAFSRRKERDIGADFHLELWIVGRKVSFPMLIQAKKFMKPHNGYCRKLNYPDPTSPERQVDRLINYTNYRKLWPFYIFYARPDFDTKVICGQSFVDKLQTSLFLSPAEAVKRIADSCRKKTRVRVSLNDILQYSCPLCTWFCPVGSKSIIDHLRHSVLPMYQTLSGERQIYFTADLPQYIQLLLSGDVNSERFFQIYYHNNQAYRIHTVATLDLR